MKTLSGKTALVTGAAGFIGGATVRRLRAAGVVVHGVSRVPRTEPDIHWWQADLGDMEDVRRLLDTVKPDVVFHLAARVSGARTLDAVLPMLRANLLATVNLLVAVTERRGPRLVLAGSLEEPPPEEGWPVPSSPYAAAKLGAGGYARMFQALYGTPAVWLRLFMAYGPAQPDVSKLVPYVTLSLLRGEAPALSNGTRPVDWVYVEDVVDALLAAAVTEGIEGRTLDVGSGTLVSVRRVVEEIVRLVNPIVWPRFGAVAERPLETVRAADAASTARWLGWWPRTSLEEGLRRTVDWYRSHGAGSADPTVHGQPRPMAMREAP